jgi:hypothetical protein
MDAKSVQRNRFAVASVLRYAWDGRLAAGLLWLGFLPVLAVLDWWRGLFSMWGYHCPGDLRAETLVTSYPARKHVEPETPWPWQWLCCSRYAMRRSLPSWRTPVQHLRAGDEFAHLCHTIRSHPHMKWFLATWPVPVANCFWLPGFALYYYLFAFPWWNWVLQRYVSGYVPAVLSAGPAAVLRVPFALLYEYPLSRVWWVVLVIHLLFVVTPIVWRRMQLGRWQQPLFILFYPFYLTLSPLVWLFIKLLQ